MDKISLIDRVKRVFEKNFGKAPLLISAPGRINLIGEHTDYNLGFVFPAAIDKYVIGAFSKNDKKYSRIMALDLNEKIEVDLNNLTGSNTGKWDNFVLGVIDEIQKKGKIIENFDLVFAGSIPQGAGMSSSAALENCIVFGLNELFDLHLDKETMINISMDAEHNFVGVKCGIMDQFASMRGKKDRAMLLDCSDLSFEYIPLKLQNYKLVLINSNVKHSLANSAYNKRKIECRTGVKIIGEKFSGIKSLRDVSLEHLDAFKGKLTDNVYRRCLYVLEENKRTKFAKEAIIKGDLEEFGALLYKSHSGLQNLYEVSCPELDFLVEQTKEYDEILGSRMMGGGFGGCTINLIKKEGSKAIIEKITEEYKKRVNIDPEIYSVNITNGVDVVN